MQTELQKFETILGELLIEEAKNPNKLDPKKVEYVKKFQDDNNIPQIFSREMLKWCAKQIGEIITDDNFKRNS